MTFSGPRRALLTAAAAAAGTVLARGLLARQVARGRLGGPDRWNRRNHRDEPVSLTAGPAVAAGAVLALSLADLAPRGRTAALLTTCGVAGVGLIDDLTGTGADKGLAGHLGALRRGQVTTGVVKIVGIGAAGLTSAALVTQRAAGEGTPALLLRIGVGGAAVAAHANLLNLFDLRPGRAAKVTLLHLPMALTATAGPTRGPTSSVVLGTALGAAVGALPDDLAERSMLGDSGANTLGALLGLGLVSQASLRGRALQLAVLLGLTLASERVSFTQVIDATPPLRFLDQLGRRPAPTGAGE